VIDTDPGLDDALALFLACASRALDIVGIVTVAGNIGLSRVTANALKLLACLGRGDVPVIAGRARPLKREPLTAQDIHGEDGLGGVVLAQPERQALTLDATAWMEDELTRRPEHSLRILALGPLTNLASLIESRPAAARRLAGIVAMGGAVRERGNVTPFAEFNIAADPEAADIVLRSGIPVTLVPLDVTRKVAVDQAFCARLVSEGGKVARISAAMIEAYLRNIALRRERIGEPATRAMPLSFPLHDPCVMLHAIAPDLFRSERLPIRVVTDSSERDGQTLIDEEVGPMVDVLMQANVEETLALAFELLSGLP
jgi:purine nucleosidase/pyrimidine-specific ribonucleoside hydrolase